MDTELICSTRGCRNRGMWALLWNNPRIHMPDRRKVWLVCSEHKEELTSYLSSRSLLKDVVPVDQIPDGAG